MWMQAYVWWFAGCSMVVALVMTDAPRACIKAGIGGRSGRWRADGAIAWPLNLLGVVTLISVALMAAISARLSAERSSGV